MDTVSADQMLVRAQGPVWHQKQTKQGSVPQGLRGLDKEATWGKSCADGGIDGHGTFSMTPHQRPMVGICQWRPNSGHEATRRQQEVTTSAGLGSSIFMDSKADDQHLSFDLQNNHHLQRVTVPCKGMDTSESRKKMIRRMLTTNHKKDSKERSTPVEPRQGLVADIFTRERCWMRGEVNNRGRFAAMGLAV
jgi:hypothetical protein